MGVAFSTDIQTLTVQAKLPKCHAAETNDDDDDDAAVGLKAISYLIALEVEKNHTPVQFTVGQLSMQTLCVNSILE